MTELTFHDPSVEMRPCSKNKEPKSGSTECLLFLWTAYREIESVCERERSLQFKVVSVCLKKPIIMREIDTHTCKH